MHTFPTNIKQLVVFLEATSIYPRSILYFTFLPGLASGPWPSFTSWDTIPPASTLFMGVLTLGVSPYICGNSVNNFE